jgi:hypothetical protein
MVVVAPPDHKDPDLLSRRSDLSGFFWASATAIVPSKLYCALVMENKKAISLEQGWAFVEKGVKNGELVRRLMRGQVQQRREFLYLSTF